MQEAERVKNLFFLVCLLSFSTSGIASAHGKLIRLVCDGKYSDFTRVGTRDITINGIYVELTKSIARVRGSIGFDGDYRIISHLINGFGFVETKNPLQTGFVNRYDGELSLVEKSKVAQNGSQKILKLTNATCHQAKAIF